MFFPPTNEDRLKSQIYREVADKFVEEDILEYLKECRRSYELERYTKPGLISRFFRRYTLEEGLFRLALEHENANEDEKRKIDHKALRLIKRCCRGSFSFLREYYGMYRDIKRGNFYIS